MNTRRLEAFDVELDLHTSGGERIGIMSESGVLWIWVADPGTTIMQEWGEAGSPLGVAFTLTAPEMDKLARAWLRWRINNDGQESE